ncbi:MAG: TrmH family RNA methyltransferase [Gemmiger sp.]
MERISSRDNAKIKYACAVRDSEKRRAADGVFFAEGPKLCLELAKSCAPRAVYATAAALEKTPALAAFAALTTEVEAHVAEKLAGTPSSQGVFALFETPAPGPERLHTARRLLALEGVQDPGNVGTLLRSAAAFGFDAVVLGPGCAAPFSPKTLRASMGAAGRLPVFTAGDLPAVLATLRARGVTCLAAALYRSSPLDAVGTDFPGGVCVVIGSEGRGLSEAAVAACDAAVRIPMTDLVESLNAGVAGSVLLWHFRGV